MQKGKPQKKYSQAGRLHLIIRLLEVRRGLTLDELAEECGVDRRTIHRDLNAVEEAGYTLTTEWQGGRKIYGFLTKSRQLPAITFTLDQLMTLYLLKSLGSHLAGTPFLKEVDDLFRSINSILPDRYAAHLERIARVALPLLHGSRDYSAAAPHIAGLHKALVHQYRIRLDYARPGNKRSEEYLVDPYTMVFHKGGIYLLCFAHNRGGMRLFALERVRGVEVTRQRFDLPEGYEPERHFQGAFGLVDDTPMQVKVRFSPDVAPGIRERIWRPDQRFSLDDEGWLVLEFEASGQMELTSWVLSYGSHAEVLEPPELRREVRRHVREMRGFYRKKGIEKRGRKTD